MPRREEIFTVETPFPGVKTATLYQNTWDEHITLHAEMVGQERAVARTLRVPSFVCAGNDPGEFGFVSHSEVDADGRPAVVYVTTNTDDKPVVTTAFRGRKTKYMDKSKFRIVWP